METKVVDFEIVKSKRDCMRGVQLQDGRVIVIWDRFDKMKLRFDEPILLDGKITTCNDIIAEGKGVEVFGYEKYRIYTKSKFPRVLRESTIKKIIKEFKEHGFNVTEDAIQHNFDCWKADMKSGFRDDENKSFLFTPCGCNPLSFEAMELREHLENWQKTYCC